MGKRKAMLQEVEGDRRLVKERILVSFQLLSPKQWFVSQLN